MIIKKQPSKKKNKRSFWYEDILPFPNSYDEVTEFKEDDIITLHEFSTKLPNINIISDYDKEETTK